MLLCNERLRSLDEPITLARSPEPGKLSVRSSRRDGVIDDSAYEQRVIEGKVRK